MPPVLSETGAGATVAVPQAPSDSTGPLALAVPDTAAVHTGDALGATSVMVLPSAETEPKKRCAKPKHTPPDGTAMGGGGAAGGDGGGVEGHGKRVLPVHSPAQRCTSVTPLALGVQVVTCSSDVLLRHRLAVVGLLAMTPRSKPAGPPAPPSVHSEPVTEQLISASDALAVQPPGQPRHGPVTEPRCSAAPVLMKAESQVHIWLADVRHVVATTGEPRLGPAAARHRLVAELM